MLISASRRNDIPNYYSDWFFDRIKEGFVFVKNPVNKKLISKISLSPDVVDGIVFWTKNPKPMLSRLKELDEKYMYYFQFTITSYGKDIEGNIPSKKNVIIPSFQKLSQMIGKNRVIWRYDPIFITKKYSIEYHIHYFELLARSLSGYTEKCVISFIDFYRKTKYNMKDVKVKPLDFEQMHYLMSRLVNIASKYGIDIETCSEKSNFDDLNIKHGSCINKELFEKLLNCKLKVKKDNSQRKNCGCVESVDIGLYDSCPNGCKYCYANNSCKNSYNGNVENPENILFDEQFRIVEKKMKSLIEYNIFNIK